MCESHKKKCRNVVVRKAVEVIVVLLPPLQPLPLSLLRPRLSQVIRRSKAGAFGRSTASGSRAEHLTTGLMSHAGSENADLSTSGLDLKVQDLNLFKDALIYILQAGCERGCI